MNMEWMESVWTRRAGAVGLLLVALLFGLWLTFPSAMIARVVEAQVLGALGPGWRVEIQGVRPTGLASVSVRGLTLTPPPATGPIGANPLPTRIDVLSVRVAPLSLLGSAPRVRIRLRADEGHADVRLTLSEERTEGQAEFDQLPLQRLGVLQRWTHLPPLGRLSGDLSFRLDDAGHPTRLHVALSIDTLVLGEGMIRSAALSQVGGMVPLPTTHFGPTSLQMQLEDRTLRLESLEARGNDIRLEVEGVSDLTRPIGSSRLRLMVRFSPSEDYVERAALGGLMEMVPVFRQAQTADGYGFLFQGTIGNPGAPEPLGR